MPKYYEISFSSTLKCNAICAHCCVDAGPRRRTHLDLLDINRYIYSAHRYGIKFIAFTGGEATLARSELYKALGCSRDRGIWNILVTNAHWASDCGQAEQMAKTLKDLGVIEIQISADMFHAKFIPFKNVLNAITAASNQGIRPIVMMARIKGDCETESLKRKLKKLAVEIVEQPVVPFAGRSQLLPKNRVIANPIGKMKHIGCVSVLSPTISPKQKVYACCASDFSFANGSALFLGDLKKNSLHTILKQHTEDTLLDALYLWGPKYLYDLVADDHPGLVTSFPKVFYGYCHLCYMLNKSSGVVNYLRSKLKDAALIKKIKIAKLVKHEKIRQLGDKRNEWYECVIEREKA